ncbi:MAG: hypothetical protein JWM08_955 [Candidatus Angelobacter sp.]|nr:hypothetical protein [Candidatus Angelobacter sp.]
MASPAPTVIPPSPSGPQQGPTLIDIINALAEKADPIIKLLQATMESYQKGQERAAKLSTHMAWLALSVVVFVVGVAALLTYKGKIDGSTFTFLLGLIVGYVLTFVRDQIKGSKDS